MRSGAPANRIEFLPLIFDRSIIKEATILMILEANRIEQIQYDLLATYSAIEQYVRSLHPGCEWNKQLKELQAHLEKRDHLEKLLMQILQRSASIQDSSSNALHLEIHSD
jgi:hypothetical protein